MKNCLIVLAVLFGCFVLAVFLAFNLNMGGPGGYSFVIATWRDYDDPGLTGLQVTIFKDQIILDVPDAHAYKRITEKGHWNLGGFYCDSHLDAPTEVEVARELANEDLELDLGRFIASHPGKIVCVKVIRGLKDIRPPYPVNVPGQTVSYPPPKGLIRVGMLECDLELLPWHADKIEGTPIVVDARSDTLSDGTKNRQYFNSFNQDDGDPCKPMVYHYHSDKPDLPELLVTVHHGRVIQVLGGAEETGDIPYELPAPSPPTSPEEEQRSWITWVFDLLFKK